MGHGTTPTAEFSRKRHRKWNVDVIISLTLPFCWWVTFCKECWCIQEKLWCPPCLLCYVLLAYKVHPVSLIILLTQNFDPKPPPPKTEPPPESLALTWVSYIGTVLSVVCLTIIIITYLGEQWVSHTFMHAYTVQYITYPINYGIFARSKMVVIYIYIL